MKLNGAEVLSNPKTREVRVLFRVEPGAVVVKFLPGTNLRTIKVLWGSQAEVNVMLTHWRTTEPVHGGMAVEYVSKAKRFLKSISPIVFE